MSQLAYAASRGDLDEVERLLVAGADVHAEDDWALRLAAENGHLAVVDRLLAAGADAHAKNDLALRWAADKGHLGVVNRLLAAGADVHADNDSALRWAAESGHAEVLGRLLGAASSRLTAAEIEALKQDAAPAVCDVLNVYTVGLALPDQPAACEQPSDDWGLRL